jgi:transglutaminase-like putative cysteine protease
LRRVIRIFAAMLAVASPPWLSGCQPAARPVPSADTPESLTRVAPADGTTPAGQPQEDRASVSRSRPPANLAEPGWVLDDPTPDGQVLEEFWEVHRLQGSRVGVAHTILSRVQQGGQTLLRVRNLTRTQLHRAGMPTRQEMEITSWETPDGRWVGFESRVASPAPASGAAKGAGGASDKRGSSAGVLVTRGTVRGQELELVTQTLGHQQTRTLPWQPDWGGPFAVDQALRRQPMQPGEQRTVWGLVPVVHVPAATDLKAHGYESVELPGGAQRLLKVEAVTRLGNQAIVSQLWLDAQGRTLRSWIPAIEQEIVRTTREDAMRPTDERPLDLLAASVVRLTGDRTPSPQARKIVYRARRTDGPIRGLFSEGAGQHVRHIDEQTAELHVELVTPETPPAQPATAAPRPPGDAERQPSSFVQSDDPQIVAMARQAAGRETDPWRVACALERFVAEAVRNTDFSQAFATAAEVARTLEGDCTEHAVLLAALCRARQIPARVAFGLVYYPPLRGFAYHMWTEVWIGNRWLPLDGTLGQGRVGPDHLKLGDSNLAGEAALADLLGIVSVFGRLELEILEQH